MSLINQMLRDLDARRGPASNVETAALQGMGLADLHTGGQHAVLYRAGCAIGLVLAGILLQQGYRLWSEQSTDQVVAEKAVTEVSEFPQESVAIIPAPSDTPAPAPEKPEPLVTASEQTPVDDVDQTVKTNLSNVSTTQATAVIPEQTPVDAVPGRTVRINTLSPAQKAQQRFNRAQSLLTAERYPAAARELLATLELDPELYDARLQLANLFLRQEHTDRALQLLDAGHQLNPGHTEIAMSYARLLAEQGAYQYALEVLNTNLRQGHVDVDTLALAAGLHYRMKQFSASASRYREALAQHPERGVLWMGLGVALDHSLQTTDALEAYRRASNTVLEINLQNFVTGRIAALSERMD